MQIYIFLLTTELLLSLVPRELSESCSPVRVHIIDVIVEYPLNRSRCFLPISIAMNLLELAIGRKISTPYVSRYKRDKYDVLNVRDTDGNKTQDGRTVANIN